MTMCCSTRVARNGRAVRAVCAILAVVAGLGAAETAKPADAMVDAIGVNVHLSYPSYLAGYTTLAQRLGASGIRHIRDGAVGSYMTRHEDLWRTYGIRTTFICSERLPGGWPAPLDLNAVGRSLDEIAAYAPNACEAIEGANEYDLSHDARETDWAGNLRQYQQKLYAAVRGSARFADRPVIAPSLTSVGAARALGSLEAWVDQGNGHYYSGGRAPDAGGWGGWFDFSPYGSGSYGSLDFNFAMSRWVCGWKPIVVTECGFYGGTAGGAVPEQVEAKYLPRMIADCFRRGAIRAFKYELIDQAAEPANSEMNYGLLRHDLTAKKSLTAISNLIALLADPGAAFTPSTLDYTLQGDTTNIRHVLLQKRDGRFALVLWQEVSSWTSMHASRRRRRRARCACNWRRPWAAPSSSSRRCRRRR